MVDASSLRLGGTTDASASTKSRRLAWLIAVAIFSLAGCNNDGCVSAPEADMWTKRAEAAEAEGHIYAAWKSYKAIGVQPACWLEPDHRAIANKERSRLMVEINGAYDAAVNAIDRFKAENGLLPSSLLVIAADIPQSSQRAFREFRYTVDASTRTYVLSGRAG